MTDLFLRKAEYEDVDLIFRWANDEEARKNSFNSSGILYEDHVKWFKGRMESENSYIFILMEKDVPVGQCRLDIQGRDALISYFIDSSFRNKGYGKSLLKLVYDEAAKIEGVDMLVGKVKIENAPSRNVFLKLGYTEEIETENEMQIAKYVLKI